MRLEGKVAFVSGGARGIGAAIAGLFASEGASVVIGDILERDGIQTETQIQEAGGEVRFVHMDVRSSSQWQHAIRNSGIPLWQAQHPGQQRRHQQVRHR